MVKVAIWIIAALRSVALFELAGSAAIVTAVYLLAKGAWALLAAGVLLLIKSFDLSVQAADRKD